jgi:hypothetical protein
MLLLKLFLGPLALGDVGVSGDKTGQLSIHEQWLTLNKMRKTAWARAFKTVRFEFKRQFRDAFDVIFRVARSVFATLGRDANQIRKVHTIKNCLCRQVEYIQHSLVPYPQAQVLIEDTDALRHAFKHGEQIIVPQSELCGFP